MLEKKKWQWVEGTTVSARPDLSVGSMYCIGKNYADHIKEMGDAVPGDPVVFLKTPTAYCPTGSVVCIPSISQNMHHEVELVVVIGKHMHNVDVSEAWNHVVGFGVGIDFTLRDVQRKAKDMGLPWAVSKSFLHSGPISPLVPTHGASIPADTWIACSVNGVEKQRSAIAAMERSIPELLSYLSTLFVLTPGDCVFTGTPAGVSQVVAGDEIAAECSAGQKLALTISS